MMVVAVVVEEEEAEKGGSQNVNTHPSHPVPRRRA